MATTQRRRPELAAFLRSRRARVTPADVGMPPGLRRRTPGLRREEVAQLSGVGVTWYTWLEQGRPINASPQVLDAVARTLRLDQPEREHLYDLAEVPYTHGSESTALAVGPEVQEIVDALDPSPAVVYNARYDILATNPAYRDVFFVPETRPAGGGVRNALWTLFTASEEDCPLVFRESELPVMVATLRAAYGRHVGEPGWEDFIRRLSEVSGALRPAVAERGRGAAGTAREDVPARGGGRVADDVGVAVGRRDAGVPDRGLPAGRRGDECAGGAAEGDPAAAEGTKNPAP